MSWLVALILLPLVGALVVAGLRDNDRAATLVALAVAVVELLLVVPTWLAYDPGGERLQQVTSFDWIPALGVHVSFGIDGIALVMIAVTALPNETCTPSAGIQSNDVTCWRRSPPGS